MGYNKEWLDLKPLLHDKEKTDKLHPILKKTIFDFIHNSTKIKRKLNKIKNLKEQIIKEQEKSKTLSKKITGEIKYIKKELQIGEQFINIYPEKKGDSFRLDISWGECRRKLTIGKTLKDVEILCKKHNNNLKEKLVNKNYRSIIKNSLRNYICKTLESKISLSKFKNGISLKINPNTLELEFPQKKKSVKKKSKDPVFMENIGYSKDRVSKKTTPIVVQSKVGGKVSSGSSILSQSNKGKSSSEFPVNVKGKTLYDSDKRYSPKEGKNMNTYKVKNRTKKS